MKTTITSVLIASAMVIAVSASPATPVNPTVGECYVTEYVEPTYETGTTAVPTSPGYTTLNVKPGAWEETTTSVKVKDAYTTFEITPAAFAPGDPVLVQTETGEIWTEECCTGNTCGTEALEKYCYIALDETVSVPTTILVSDATYVGVSHPAEYIDVAYQHLLVDNQLVEEISQGDTTQVDIKVATEPGGIELTPGSCGGITEVGIKDIRDLQKRLNKLGASLVVDGIKGTATKAAMAKYQVSK